MLTLKVAGQIIKPVCCDTLVSDSLNILEIQFVFDAAWEGLAKTAQFTQVNKDGSTGETFDRLLDEFGTVMLPNEIHQGVVNISVFGVKDNRRLTTAPLAVPVVESGFIGKTLLIPTPEIYMQIMNTIAPNKAAYDAMTAELQKAILNAYQKTQMAVNEADARLEAIIQAAGDLDGDAELLDIRLGENGENYSTAGTAVREQFRKQREELILKFTTPFSITGAVAACHPVGGYPLEVISHIEPVQDGSGWTGAALTRTGKNLIPADYENGTKTVAGITYTLNNDGTVTANGTAGNNVSFHINTQTYYPAGVYRLSGGISNNARFVANRYRADGGESSGVADIGNGATLTLTERTRLHLYLVILEGTTVNNVVFRPQIEIGTTATAYEKSKFEEITAQFGQTIYGGEYNWKTGILTITHALDGKQAVTALSVPEKIQLTPKQILSLEGATNLWSDCGETTVNGPTEPKYRDAQQDARIAALEAAILNA